MKREKCNRKKKELNVQSNFCALCNPLRVIENKMISSSYKPMIVFFFLSEKKRVLILNCNVEGLSRLSLNELL